MRKLISLIMTFAMCMTMLGAVPVFAASTVRNDNNFIIDDQGMRHVMMQREYTTTRQYQVEKEGDLPDRLMIDEIYVINGHEVPFSGVVYLISWSCSGNSDIFTCTYKGTLTGYM